MITTDPGLATVIDQHYAELAAGLPFTDAARLTWADRLEEQGQCDRAELIRVQCELAAMPTLTSKPVDKYWRDKQKSLRRREHVLLEQNIGNAKSDKDCWSYEIARAIQPVVRRMVDFGYGGMSLSAGGFIEWNWLRGFPAILSGIRPIGLVAAGASGATAMGWQPAHQNAGHAEIAKAKAPSPASARASPPPCRWSGWSFKEPIATEEEKKDRATMTPTGLVRVALTRKAICQLKSLTCSLAIRATKMGHRITTPPKPPSPICPAPPYFSPTPRPLADGPPPR